MVQIPYIEVPPELRTGWWRVLEAHGIACKKDRPLHESIAELEKKGFTISDPTDLDLKSSSAYVGSKGKATIKVIGAMDPTMNVYLISIHFQSGLFRRNIQNSELAQEAFQCLLTAGGRIFDVDDWWERRNADLDPAVAPEREGKRV
jgi:hypothetical protein